MGRGAGERANAADEVFPERNDDAGQFNARDEFRVRVNPLLAFDDTALIVGNGTVGAGAELIIQPLTEPAPESDGSQSSPSNDLPSAGGGDA